MTGTIHIDDENERGIPFREYADTADDWIELYEEDGPKIDWSDEDSCEAYYEWAVDYVNWLDPR